MRQQNSAFEILGRQARGATALPICLLLPNRWSSERHRACTFGRVANEEDEVKCILPKRHRRWLKVSENRGASYLYNIRTHARVRTPVRGRIARPSLDSALLGLRQCTVGASSCHCLSPVLPLSVLGCLKFLKKKTIPFAFFSLLRIFAQWET